jgi:UDP-N-acetylmuramate--L-alanine ligase/UDP-N-acetylenolpyruvoylglucosamine reductase
MTGDTTVQHFEPSTITELPPRPARFHFIGIGGISMSGLARILHDWGYQVTGSDRQASAATALLEKLGITVQIGHEESGLAGRADVLVVTPRAIPGAPNEIRAAVGNRAEVVRRGQLLGMIANARINVAASGSHGKSTTSGMLTTALTTLGADPSYSVGAMVGTTGRNADSGDGPHMVVEADEFDRALLWLKPHVAIITTVSFDHPDCFADQADYDQAFIDFGVRVRSGGTLVISEDDPGCQRVIDALREHPDFAGTIVTFGEQETADWSYRRADSGWVVTGPDGASRPIELQVPGAHNVANAAAAIATLVTLGHSADEAILGVEAFSGVGRRFEHKGEVAGIDVFDDYAHHPDEIRATLAGARDRYRGRRLVALFQPHTYSRTQLLLDGFAETLGLADLPVLLDIYPAGEENVWGVSSASVAARMTTPATVLATPDDAVAWLERLVQPGDIVLTLGAGDVTVVSDRLVDALRRRHREIPEAPVRRAGAVAASMPLPGADAPIQRDVDMSMHTTMRIGGRADYLVRAATPEVVEAAAAWAAAEGLPVTVIGGGSNLLVSDDGIRGLVIVVRTPGQRAEALLHAEDEGDHVLLRVGAQAPISWLGRHCAERGWAGMDWAVGLPGQVGGATVNNAGAHGTEVKDHLEGIEVLEDGVLREYERGWLEPAFRMTRIKGAPRPRPWIVTRAVFRLPKGDPAALLALADEHAEFRKTTQPTGACSGSVFVNPEGDFAGRLLEEAGLKGTCVGNVAFSGKHANWIINAGGGTARDTWALIQQARGVILDRYGIDLRPEIERVGAWPDLYHMSDDQTEQDAVNE